MNNKQNHTSRLPFRLLRVFCPPQLLEEIEGDLLQRYERDLNPSDRRERSDRYWRRRANRRLLWNVIRFCRPAILLRHKIRFQSNLLYMAKGNFRVAARTLLKNRVLSLINVIGLSVGMATFFVIARYVSYEMSYDNFHLNKDQIYRVAFEQRDGDKLTMASAKNFVGIPSLLQQLPEVETVTSFDRTASQAYFLFRYKEKNFYHPGSFYQTDSNFFKVFPSLLLIGDPSSALSDPHNLVLSQRMAKVVFGNESPIGKKIENRSFSYSDVATFVVTGIMIDAPDNAHFHLDFIARNTHDDEVSITNYWTGPHLYSYLTLAPAASKKRLAGKLNALLEKIGRENPKYKGVKANLQAIGDIHNYSNLQDELEVNGNGSLLYLLAAIGIAVLVAAWINYVNFESSRFIARAKEIAIRRIIGSGDSSLAFQFSTEYFLTTILAVGLAALPLYFFHSQLNEIMGLPNRQPTWSTTWSLAYLIFLLGSFIVGILPVILFIKKYPQVKVRSGIIKYHFNSPVRKILIAFQFVCSISLIAILMVVSSQLKFMMLTNKKMDIENVVSIRNPAVYANETDSINLVEFKEFRRQLSTSSLVKNATSSSAIPGMAVEETFVNRLKRHLGDPHDPVPYRLLFVDYNFIPFYDLNLKAGRNYSVESGDDENWNTVILNESAVRSLGFSSAEEAKDQEVYFHLWGGDFKKYKIIGIVEDYHHEIAKSPIYPTILSLNHSQFQQVFYSVKLNSGTNPQEGLSAIEESWKKIFPDRPFEFFFQDDYYDRQFKIERKFGYIFGLFSMVSILIACLGILGMTMSDTISRLKEVSIRKVLGASIAHLVSLLSIGYLKLIVLSFIASIPIIYYFSRAWLNNYPLRTNLSVWYFLLPVATVMTLVAASSGLQVIKAALTNPVNQLKHD